MEQQSSAPRAAGLGGLALALALLPAALAAIVALAQAGHHLYPWGDHAVVETETLKTWHGDQLLGTYSRYQWHHPGPALFWFMAPLYVVFGHASAALNAAAALLNLIAIAVIVSVTRRCAGRGPALVAAALTGLWIAQVGPLILRDFWIPHTVMLPFAALIVATAAVAAGRLALLPVVAVLASFEAETDLSVAPASAAVVAAGALVFVAARAWRGLPPRRSAEWVGGSLALAALVWWPPLHEELQTPHGNVQTLRKFFATPAPGHSLHTAIDAVSNALTTLPAGTRTINLATPADLGAHVVLGLAVVLLVAGLVVAARRGRRFGAALCAISLAALAAETYAITKIRGDVFTYLVEWFGATGIAIPVAVTAALGPELAHRRLRLARPLVVLALAATVVLALVDVVQVARHASFGAGDPAYSQSAAVEQTWPPVDRWLRRNRVRDPLVNVASAAQWPFAAGTVLQLFRDGRPVSVDPAYGFMFGKPFAPTGREDAAIVFADAGGQPEPGMSLLARTPATTVYARRLPASAPS